MDFIDIVSNFVFNKSAAILADGITPEKVKEGLAGLKEVLSGLSETEMTGMVNSLTPLKSYVDKHTTEGIKTREKTLNTEIETNKRKHAEEKETLQSTINTLKSSQPVSGDPVELRKQALDEPDPSKRELLNLKADNIENKKKLADMEVSDTEKEKKLTKQTLLDVVRSEIGDRKLPKTVSDNLDFLIGVDEETTKGKVKIFTDDWDVYAKDLKTAEVIDDPPPGGGDQDKNGETAMLEKMNKKEFLNT